MRQTAKGVRGDVQMTNTQIGKPIKREVYEPEIVPVPKPLVEPEPTQTPKEVPVGRIGSSR